MITNGKGVNDFNVGLPGDDCNPSYFKIPVIALVLITILNDGTIISIAYDNVKPSPVPEQWNLLRVCIVSMILGIIACGKFCPLVLKWFFLLLLLLVSLPINIFSLSKSHMTLFFSFFFFVCIKTTPHRFNNYVVISWNEQW